MDFFSYNGQVAWSLDPNAHNPLGDTDDSHDNLVADENLFSNLSRQHKHGTKPANFADKIEITQNTIHRRLSR